MNAPTATKPGIRPWMLFTAIGITFFVATLFSVGVTSAVNRGISSGGGTTQSPEPEVVVETETVTEEVKVETTPQACVDALDSSDSLMRMFGEALTISGDAMMDAVNMDWTALDEKTAQLELLTPKVEDERAAYDKASTECRASVEG